MSYAKQMKQALIQQPPQKPCCRKALINGFLYVTASLRGQEICALLSGKETVSYFTELVAAVYHTEPHIESRRGGGGAVTVLFHAPSALKFVQKLSDCGTDLPLFHRCDECQTHFLRGVFLACAHPSDPNKEFRLDLTPSYRAVPLAAYLSSLGLPPHQTLRGERELLYYRSADAVSDFFGRMDMMDAYFQLQNEYLKKDLNNLANRQSNCTIHNIGRSVESTAEQVRLIRRMKEQNKLSLLPEELKATAELRLMYDNYSLSQLVGVAVPPISKSGLNHRLQKIMEIAQKTDL